MRTSSLIPAMIALAVLTTAAGGEPPAAPAAGEPGFSARPAIKKAGDKTTLSFTASAPTDVEVAVLDAGGRIVRHLAAGVLGGETAPPAPLKAGLSQELEWDGLTDTGAKAAGGPFKVSVRLGMRAELDGFIGESKYWIGDLCGLATDPEGNLYVYSSSVAVHRGSSRYLQIFNRKGEYQRTIMPMPADLPREKLLLFNTSHYKGRKIVLDVPGERYCPRNYFGTWPEFYPGEVGQIVPRVTRDGIVTVWGAPRSIMRIRNDGTSADAFLWRGLWDKKSPRTGCGPQSLVPSPDGRYLYLSGMCSILDKSYKGDDKVDKDWPDRRIYRMELGRAEATMEKFVELPVPDDARSFTDPRTSYGGSHTGTGGADCDPDGNLLVCDRMNKRLRVFDPAGKEIGGFGVEWAQHVAVHGKAGHVYIMTNKPAGYGKAAKTLLKYSSWKRDAKLLATFEFASANGYEASIALDDSQEPPVIWAAGDLVGKRSLLRIEDRGGSFEVTANLLDLNKDRFGVKPRMAVHPETDMIICNDGAATLNGYDGLTGKEVKLPFDHGADMAVGLDGNWYIQTGKGYSGWICRYDRELKPLPVPAPPPGKGVPANALGWVYGRMGAGFCTVGTAADPKGRVYSMQMYAWAPYCVAVYGPDGKPEDPGRLRDDPAMQKAERFKSALVGPMETKPGGIQLDWQGNIYIGLGLRSPDWRPPPGFETDSGYNDCVGSVVKFKPEGGAIVKGDAVPEGKSGLIMQHHSYGRGPRFLENAVAAYPELGCMSGNFGDGCMCRQPMFQVDGWGRLYIPNAITCSVRIVDNAGNLIQQFGAYGNIDSRGPGGDSMIKTPAVPLGWPEAVGASHKAVYVSDVVNRRIVRMKKVYAAEETLALP